MSKHKKPQESCQGQYTALPHELLDSVALMGAGHTARSLLLVLLRQHNGRNNGHIHMAAPWMKKRGWTSGDVLHRAKLKLIKRGLIIQTRQGGLNAGANLYAVTWLDITNFDGLDIQSKDYHPGAWRFMDTLPVIGKHKLSSATRCATAPPHGVPDPLAAPPDGAKKALSGASTAPFNGNNEYTHTSTVSSIAKGKRPVVGAKGKSGKRKKQESTSLGANAGGY
jgi:hypothetical protein